jgi:8-oxo-dGTP pyrophosphatase MutT (NUDIX family)
MAEKTFTAPATPTTGLQGYDLEGAKSPRKKRKSVADYLAGFTNPGIVRSAKKSAPARAAGIALITRDDGHVLFLQRSGDDHDGEWCLPGGGLEPGETEEQAAVRELFEETGIKLDDDGSRIKVGTTTNSEIEYATFAQKVDTKIEPRLNGEHSAWRWASLDTPPEPLHPWVRAALPLVKSAAVDLTLKAAAAAHLHEENKKMENLALFVPVLKVDAKQRIVYGTAVAEEADRSKEIFDYKSSKPEFEKWSADFEKVTDGKSKGNVRAMHGKVAAGKVIDIGFDDDRKAIDVAVKIVDEEEWQKVLEGVYTGFSIGGRYLKRWQDGELKRYTAAPSEISLVDLPCVPSATFTMVKADGSEEICKFTSIQSDTAEVKPETAEVEKTETVTEKTVEPKPEVTNSGDDWAQVWVSKRLPGKMFAKKAELQQALVELDAQELAEKRAAEVIAEIEGKKVVEKTEEVTPEAKPEAVAPAAAEKTADVTPEKAAEPEAKPTGGEESAEKAEDAEELVKAEGETDEAFEKRKFDAKQRKKAAKDGDAESDGSYPIENKTDLENAVRAYGRSKNKSKTKRHIMARARALGLSNLLPADWKSAKKAVSEDDLKKDANLYVMADLMQMLAYVESLEDRAEQKSYGFGVDLPKDVTDRFGLALINLGDVVADILDAVLGEIREEERGEAVNRAAEIAGLAKAVTTEEETAVNKEENGETEKAADTEITPEPTADADARVAAITAAFDKKVTEMQEAMKKSQEETDAKVAKLQSEKDELHKQVMVIRSQPAAARGMNLRVVEKSVDSNVVTAEKAATVSTEDLRQAGLNAQMNRIGRR